LLAALIGTYARQSLAVRTTDRSQDRDKLARGWREPREESATAEV
jgi:hypothetical protein